MRIMGVLPQQATPADIARLEKELYLGLPVVEGGPPDLDAFVLAEDGIGYVIDGPEAGHGKHARKPSCHLG